MFLFMNFYFFFKYFINYLVWIEIDIYNIKGIFLEVKFLNDYIWYWCECMKYEIFNDLLVRFDKIINVFKMYLCLFLWREKVNVGVNVFW